MKKRLISLLLAVSMVLTFLPAGAVSAFADDEIDPDKGVLLKGGETIDETMVKEKGSVYQMKNDYDAGIQVSAKDITIYITGDVTYTRKSGGADYLLEVKQNCSAVIHDEENYKISAEANRCGVLYGRSGGSVTVFGGELQSTNNETILSSACRFELHDVDITCTQDCAFNNHKGHHDLHYR